MEKRRPRWIRSIWIEEEATALWRDKEEDREEWDDRIGVLLALANGSTFVIGTNSQSCNSEVIMKHIEKTLPNQGA
eukprot:scaffold3581_cov252-Pinguiococcus_pyrenoidosus.AAC.27